MAWKRTEKAPDFADHCRRICARYGVDYHDFDVVRDAIEENLEKNPIAGSVPITHALPEVRRFVFEPLPQHWNLPPLVVVLQVDVGEEVFTLLEIWTEEELAEQA
jgi:hypothetical protein